MSTNVADSLRNIAIIAHVDHGKTTLIDKLLHASGTMDTVSSDRVMDKEDLEKERGITILAKNTGLFYNGHTINLVDTPGHTDFGGEVERTLQMVEGFLLLVDAAEGVLPGTRFVLQKALALGLKPLVVINKVDRPDANIDQTQEQINDLFLDLATTDDQLHFDVLYGSSKEGFVSRDPQARSGDMQPLLEALVDDFPAPKEQSSQGLQLLVTSLDYSEFLGPIAVGRVFSGSLAVGDQFVCCKDDTVSKPMKVTKLYTFQGLDRVETSEVSYGDIVCVTGFSQQPEIGMTLCKPEAPLPLSYVAIDEPTLTMYFSVNDSPFAGKDGEYLTSRQIKIRLDRELRTNVALRVEETDSPEVFKVSGRGQLHLGVLVEQMRREGYELQVSAPEVIYKTIDGKKHEPLEYLVVDVAAEHQGTVMQMLGQKKAELKVLDAYGDGSRVRMEFEVPSRGLLGFRNQFMTETRGSGIATFSFHGYTPYKGDIGMRQKGALVSMEQGETTTYALNMIQERGTLFVEPGVAVYEGMILGENSREEDLTVNPCKTKKLTNMRASGSDELIKVEPPRKMTLEMCMEWITPDELIEVTPSHIRLRKKKVRKKG